MVVFALYRVYCAALIESKNFVAQVKSIGKDAQSFVQAIASLHVKLGVSIKINVAARTLQAQNRIVRRAVGLERVLKEVGVVVGNRKPAGESRLVISQSDVPGVGRLALQSWMVTAPIGEA